MNMSMYTKVCFFIYLLLDTQFGLFQVLGFCFSFFIFLGCKKEVSFFFGLHPNKGSLPCFRWERREAGVRTERSVSHTSACLNPAKCSKLEHLLNEAPGLVSTTPAQRF